MDASADQADAEATVEADVEVADVAATDAADAEVAYEEATAELEREASDGADAATDEVYEVLEDAVDDITVEDRSGEDYEIIGVIVAEPDGDLEAVTLDADYQFDADVIDDAAADDTTADAPVEDAAAAGEVYDPAAVEEARAEEEAYEVIYEEADVIVEIIED